LEKNKFVVIEVENADGGYTHTDWVNNYEWAAAPESEVIVMDIDKK